jgi:DNA-binding NtrC family response regulator
MATILLVDDDPLQALQHKSILERRFPNVCRVADAAEALCLIEEQAFAENLGLVVSGHHMPGFGKPAFIAELHQRMPSLPVLVLKDEQEDAAAYKGNQVQILARPFLPEALLNMADRMLTRKLAATA